VILVEYMARMDGADPERALELMEPDLSFLLALPAARVRGSSRDDFAEYIAGRNAGDRIHVVRARAVDGHREFVSGVVTEAGTATGTFVSTAVVSPAGRLARYMSCFDTEFDL